MLDRVGGDDPATLTFKVLAFRRYMLVQVAVEAWFRHATSAPRSPTSFGFALFFTLCLGFGLSRRFHRPAVELLALATVAYAVWWLPQTANHLWLEAIICSMLALFDPASDAENELLLKGLRWLPVLVLFWSGVKKLIYGYYFDATFIGQMIAYDPRFREFFRLLLDPAEYQRLVRTVWPGQVGDGPYAVNSALVVALSNATWILEIVLPAALLCRARQRVASVVIVFVLAIELVARELFFGALFTALLLLYSPRDLNRRLFPLFLAFLAWMLLVAAGVVPRWNLA